jgi:galactokinase
MDTDERMRMIEAEMNSRFGERGGASFFRAPGRVDIMGSHTDYNEGFILASTVDRDIIAGARPRKGGVLNLFSINTGLEVRVNIESLRPDPEHGWANYPKGVVKELIDLKVPVSGLDLVVHGEIPVGGNLSSSAALEAVTCEALLGLTDTELPTWERVWLCQRAENVFVGMPCGIMDQFSVYMGNTHTALLLDCRTLEFNIIPFSTENVVLTVIDSGLGRKLVESRYQERVGECKEAVKIIRGVKCDIKTLRDANMEDIERARHELGDVLARRARHVIAENDRVKDAGEAIEAGSFKTLGRVMEECYKSCRDDYENSTKELDVLHDLAAKMSGVYGVRICGAGWGGCLLALVEREKAKEFELELPPRYKYKTGNDGKVWVVEPSSGAGMVAEVGVRQGR